VAEVDIERDLAAHVVTQVKADGGTDRFRRL
jgi:hypothetical protein